MCFGVALWYHHLLVNSITLQKSLLLLGVQIHLNKAGIGIARPKFPVHVGASVVGSAVTSVC